MRKYKIAVLDDYQNVALESADWSVLRDRADITVFRDHLDDPDAVIERLLPFDVVCVMRERTPLPRNVIERLPNLKLIASTGSGNASIDVAGIRVNALSPGYIDTAPWRSDSVAEIRANIMSSGIVPSGRFGTSDEVAKIAVFLASDDSSYVTGTELFVDGGVA
jgi:phosphoglycerate dehydrogenase-like enzyme